MSNKKLALLVAVCAIKLGHIFIRASVCIANCMHLKFVTHRMHAYIAILWFNIFKGKVCIIKIGKFCMQTAENAVLFYT